MKRSDEELALRRGIATLVSSRTEERFAALLALRTVAFHLRFTDLHRRIDAALKSGSGNDLVELIKSCSSS